MEYKKWICYSDGQKNKNSVLSNMFDSVMFWARPK
jgi:hypothetical protein